MKLKFKKLIIDNFLSFGHAEIDLADRGYTLIEGINQNPKDGAKSNGSGKSTIFSALCYALTGETIQGLSSNLNNIFTNGNMSVTLIFSADKDNYEITRSRDNKNKADLNKLIKMLSLDLKYLRKKHMPLRITVWIPLCYLYYKVRVFFMRDNGEELSEELNFDYTII